MTPKIKPDDLQETVYKVGGFVDAEGEPVPFDGANHRTSNSPKDSNGDYYDEKKAYVNKHFVQETNRLSFILLPEGVTKPVTKLLKFGPQVAADNILYLPYHQKNITSTVIPIKDSSVAYFITDELSGCNFFIDKLEENGNLVCHHANAFQHSPTKEQLKDNAGAFNQLAVQTMDDQHDTARRTFRPTKPVVALRAEDYYAKAQSSVQKLVDQGKTDVEFYGGATVMGFREGTQWEFWFQTYARLTYRTPEPTPEPSPSGVKGLLKKVKGLKGLKGKEGKADKEDKEGSVVRITDAKLEIIEARRFWP